MKTTIALLFAAVTTSVYAVDQSQPNVEEIARQLMDQAVRDQARNREILGRYGSLQATLTLEDAKKLMADPFESAKAIAAMRPASKRELASIKITSVDKGPDGINTSKSMISFSPLPGGLLYWEHDLPKTAFASAGHEAAIDIYGLATILTWSSRNNEPRAILMNKSKPYRISVESGKPFSLTSDFSFAEYEDDVQPLFRMDCHPTKISFDAVELNRNLSGKASIFECRNEDANTLMVWLDDVQQYIYLGSSYPDDPSESSQITIEEVTYRAPHS